jgi:very-short-patch-repair endonuclease
VRNRRVLGHEVDHLWPALRLIVELDGAAYHRSALQMRRDRERDRELVLAGYTVLRFMWAEVVHAPDRVLGDLHAAIATLAARPRVD